MIAFMKGLLNYCTVCTLISIAALLFCEIRKRIVFTKEERKQHLKELEEAYARDPGMQLLGRLLGASTGKDAAYCCIIIGTYIPGVNALMWKTLFSPLKDEEVK